MTTYTGFDVAFRATTVKVATDLNISSVFSASSATEVNVFALMFDALLVTDDVKLVTLPSGFRYLKRKGTGLRVAIRVKSFDTDVKLTVSAVAAQTTLKLASTTYRVEGIGVSSEVLAAFLSLPITGTFDDRTFKLLRAAVAQTFPNYLESVDIGTGDYSVPLPDFQNDPAAQARSICYAASMVAQLKKLSYALAHRPADIVPEAVMVAYSRFTGSADLRADKPPTTPQGDRAGLWLATGSFHS